MEEFAADGSERNDPAGPAMIFVPRSEAPRALLAILDEVGPALDRDLLYVLERGGVRIARIEILGAGHASAKAAAGYARRRGIVAAVLDGPGYGVPGWATETDGTRVRFTQFPVATELDRRIAAGG